MVVIYNSRYRKRQKQGNSLRNQADVVDEDILLSEQYGRPEGSHKTEPNSFSKTLDYGLIFKVFECGTPEALRMLMCTIAELRPFPAARTCFIVLSNSQRKRKVRSVEPNQ